MNLTKQYKTIEDKCIKENNEHSNKNVPIFLDKSYDLSESDKIVVMYSKDRGLIKGVAKGVKKPKSKLGARMDMLVANTVMFHKGKNLDATYQ